MSASTHKPLGSFMATTSNLDPSKYPDEIFELYSIPAFDSAQPEIAAGRSIGSSKQIVLPGDVLLSKIVPHIRRAWIVGPASGRRMIASGEWIVFRDSTIDTAYLRHVLVSDPFHAQFMRTVSGVGGSLLRARPTYVAQIEVPVPSVAQQRHIAEVLDRAEALRAKRRAALTENDVLAQTIFMQMFDDPIVNSHGWARRRLREHLTTGPQNGLYKPASDYGSGTPILRIDSFYDGAVTELGDLRRVRISDEEEATYGLRTGEIVVNRVNSMEYLGKSAVIPELIEPTVFESNMMRFDVDRTSLDPVYLIQFLQTSFVKGQIRVAAKQAVNQASINQQDVKSIWINVPPLDLQQEFARRVRAIERMKAAQRASLAEMDALFASLQHRAFRGEL